jgi:hypothetical protein
MMWQFSLGVPADASAKTDGIEFGICESSKSSFRIRIGCRKIILWTEETVATSTTTLPNDSKMPTPPLKIGVS